MFRRDACRWFGALVLVALTACGPWGDRPLGAEIDGRNYAASCRTRVPTELLGDPLEGVTVYAYEWADTQERLIDGVALDQGFAIHMPRNVCGKHAKWVLLFDEGLSSDRVDELIASFSAAA